MSLFISSAYAAGPAAPANGGLIQPLIMGAVFIAFFYFMIWRPQAKRAKEQRALLDSLVVGSEVVFAGGLMGRIKKLDGDFSVITISSGVDLKVQKAAIATVLPEGTLAKL
jgi:preprotein translocase subunit YajC